MLSSFCMYTADRMTGGQEDKDGVVKKMRDSPIAIVQWVHYNVFVGHKTGHRVVSYIIVMTS